MKQSSEPNPNKGETPPSFWKRPWRGPARIFAWFALLGVAAFVVFVGIGLCTKSGPRGSDLVLPAFAWALGLTGVLWAGFVGVRWLCRWRNLRRVLFGMGCFATLIALLYAEENWRGKHLWQNYRRALEAKGEKFELADFIPAPVKDEKNFALTPLLKPLLEYTNGPAGVVWNDTNGLARLEDLSAYLGSKTGRDEADIGSLERGTFAELKHWAEFYRGNTNYPQAAATGTAAETVLVALGKFDPELKELREAALSRPECRFPIRYNDEPPWGILLPHLAHMKGLTILTYVHATAELETGHSEQALADLRLGWRLSGCVASEPFLISHLVRIATLNIDLETVREGLVRHAWSESQLAELESYLAGLNLLAEYKSALRSERACTTTGLEYMRRQGLRNNIMDYIADENGGSGSASSLGAMPSGWTCQNMLTIARLHQEFTIPAVDEQAHRVFPEITEAGVRAVARMRAGPYTIFAKLLFPALDKAVRKSACAQSYVDEARVACALERYRLANGKLPETLEALAPRFLAAVPHDVIDGNALRYRAEAEGGYLLYSIGWNQRDDGGAIAFKAQGPKASVDVTQGDWVWKMPGGTGSPKGT